MARNLQATRTRVHRQIARWGTRAFLRREGVDRACVAGFIKVRPVDKSLVVEGQHEVLISAIDPDTAQPLALPPDWQQDELVLGGEVLRLGPSHSGPEPSGDLFFYQLTAYFKENVATTVNPGADFIDEATLDAVLTRLFTGPATQFLDESVFDATTQPSVGPAVDFLDEALFAVEDPELTPPLNLDADFVDEALFAVEDPELTPPLNLDADFVDEAAFAADVTLEIGGGDVVPPFIAAGAPSNTAGANNITPALPAGIQPGDFLIAHVHINGAGQTLSVSAGWTLEHSGPSSGWAWRIATGTDSAPTFSWQSSFQASAGVLAYSGVDTSDPIGASAVAQAFTGNMLSAQITTTAHNSRVICFFARNGTGALVEDESGNFTERLAIDLNPELSYQDVGVATGGSQSPVCNAGASGGSFWRVFTVEVLSG